MDDLIRWCLHPLARLHWRRWGEDWVVYDEASGMTHRLDTLRATTLLLIEEGPTDLAELAAGIDAELQTGVSTELGAAISAALAELEGVRLIRRVVP